MTVTQKDLEAGLADLRDRVAWIEENLSLPARAVAEEDQAARDEELLSRTPNSYEEAKAQEAARERQAARKKPAEVEETPTPAKQPAKKV